MQPDQLPVYATAALILGMVLSQLWRRSFDPFAPIWLFLAGYAQLYVIQAISYREWALRARGPELVTSANFRALWALVWFLVVYHSGVGRWLALRMPSVPRNWSVGLITGATPVMVAWGALCAGIYANAAPEDLSAEGVLFRQFPILLLEAGVLLLVTGRRLSAPRPLYTAVGLALVVGYLFIFMFNGKRSHSMIAVLAGVCAFYLPRWRRPSIAVMGATGVLCVVAVTLALGWRGNSRHQRYERSPAGFLKFVAEFDPSDALVNMNLKERDDGGSGAEVSKETEEYGGFLLMMATVPHLSGYDYGACYLRVVSSYIPRIVWANKPIYGREQWINAWIAGSEQVRDSKFTGPAIGILGAGQLNGGATGTAIMMAVVAAILRAAYDYYRTYADRPWAQAWWSMTYFNAWMLTANDDPSVFFYYLYGHTILAPMALLWLVHKLGVGGRSA